MMSIVQDIVHATVVTESGTRLGRVIDVVCDEGVGRLISISVQPSGVAARLTREHLSIRFEEIIRLEPQHVVVPDRYVPVQNPAFSAVPSDV